MLRAGGSRGAAALLRPRGGGCSYYRRGTRISSSSSSSSSSRALASSTSSTSSTSTNPQQPPPLQPPPGARVVARQVRTDHGGYKATLYYRYTATATAEAAAGPAEEPPSPLKGTRYGKLAPPKDAVTLQVGRTAAFESLGQSMDGVVAEPVCPCEGLSHIHTPCFPPPAPQRRPSQRTGSARCCRAATRAPSRRATPSTSEGGRPEHATCCLYVTLQLS